jgi:hypothetical protein
MWGCTLLSGFITISASVFQTHDHQNRLAWDVGGEQVQETPDTGGGLASAGRAFQEDLALDGALDERELMVGKFDTFHPGNFLWYNKDTKRET